MEVSVEFWGSTPGHPSQAEPPPVDLCVSSFPDNQRREAALLGVPGARNLLCRSTRGTKPTLPEYQGHETYSTRHRRAPAGRPRAGVRVGGSSGPRVGLHGREGHARRALQTPLRSSQAERSVARPRRPPAPAVLPRSPRRSAGPLPREEGTPPAERRGLRKHAFLKPSPALGRPSLIGWAALRASGPPAGAPTQSPARATRRCHPATWLILPVAYACLKD
ncbi:hypothetical protein Q5P01_000716 [Channa striata]|uniref:Uncharacterized protein n=1 Tax=Channa striata TaxID=64152 RepID=A0AA88IKS0_CHASR|nr:hypothetical protein Q5P01_000716 [Channa striata]